MNGERRSVVPSVLPPKEPKPAWKPYPSDVTEAAWRLLEPLLPHKQRRGQQRLHRYRELLDAIVSVLDEYVLDEGSSWPAMPHGHAPRSAALANRLQLFP